MSKFYLISSLILCFVKISYSQPGGLDSSFGTNGIVTTDFGFGETIYTCSAVQSDGKIVAAGYTSNGTDYDFAIARYNPDGSPDNTFDTDGKQTTDFGFSDEIIYSIVIQTDGKLTVAGNTSKGNNFDFALARYNINGSLDTTFDGDGKQTTDFNAANNYCFSAAIQKNGKIVVAGYSDSTSKRDFALARYTTDGRLDTTFDGDGKKTTDFGSSDEIAYTVVIQSDDKIIAAGYTGNESKRDFALVRFNANGTYDTTFDKDGKRTTDFDSSNDIAYSMALQIDGKIVLAGNSTVDFHDDFALARYNTDGTIDSTFDRDGKQTTDFNLEANTASAVAILSNGKIVAAGRTFISDSASFFAYFALARYHKDGRIDSTFSEDGKQITIADGEFDFINSIVIEKNKLYAAGQHFKESFYGIVARYLLDENNQLEAEDAVLSGAIVASNHPGFTGTGYADYIHPSGDYIEWTVGDSLAGSYSLKFRYANGGTTDRPLKLVINGNTDTAMLAFIPTGGWATWSVTSAIVKLNAGANKVRLITIGSNGPNVDHLKFELVKKPKDTLEAEEAVLNGVVVSSNHTGFTGAGYADYIHPSGDYIEWTVNDSAAGLYSLKFRYANGGASDRPLKLEVNGVVVAASLAFSPTANWTTWSVSSATAGLIAGTNKVRLTAIGSNGPNVDHLKFEVVKRSKDTLEAEEAVLNGAIVSSNHTGFTGTGYADYVRVSGDYIEWTVVGDSLAGSYLLKFRYANGGAADRPLKLEVNGVVVTANLVFSPTGSWTNWSFSSATANLTAGSNKVRLTTIGSNGPNVDHLKVEKVKIPTDTLEAEDALLNGPMAAFSHPDFTGTGYADYINASADYIEWTVNVKPSDAGLYSLQFRYANGGNADRPLKLGINGVTVAASLSFSPTGSWATWSVSSAAITLNTGIYKIRLTTIGFNGPNIDHLVFNNSNSILSSQIFVSGKSLLPVLPHSLLTASVAPNPVDRGNAKLILSAASNIPVNLQLVDMLGRRYKSFELAPGRSDIFDFPVNDMPPGTYIIMVSQGNLSTHARLIVGRK